MTNYICINGKKAELTEEQMKALGIELPKVNPFAKCDNELDVYFINSMGRIQKDWNSNNLHYEVGNYCTDKEIMEQRALHEILNRLLWRYSMEHDGDKIDWNIASKNKYFIYYNRQDLMLNVSYANTFQDIGKVHFYSEKVAYDAIQEIIVPFMKTHPEFKW